MHHHLYTSPTYTHTDTHINILPIHVFNLLYTRSEKLHFVLANFHVLDELEFKYTSFYVKQRNNMYKS